MLYVFLFRHTINQQEIFFVSLSVSLPRCFLFLLIPPPYSLKLCPPFSMGVYQSANEHARFRNYLLLRHI